MPRTTHASPVAVAYARSLLELANEQNQTQAIATEVQLLRQVLTENPSFVSYLADPAIGQVERAATLKRIFEGKLSSLLMRFILVANDRARLGMLADVMDAFDELLDEQLGKIEVDVTVAHRLSAQQLEEVRQRVSKALKKDAVLHQYIDPGIIGGLILRVQDQLIDGSVKAQLAAMRAKLLAARSHGTK
ncbi:MAG: ATP synthase F1 subunit delta [Tepidisphaeraceae bacterium]